jgi:hypothetical protein
VAVSINHVTDKPVSSATRERLRCFLAAYSIEAV